MASIKLKRGAEADIPTLSLAELGFTTDTRKLFIGNGIGNILLAMASSVDIIKSIDDDYNANASELLMVNSLIQVIQITLPSDPENGDKVLVCDTGYNAAINNITMARNGNNVNNFDEDFIIDMNGTSALFMFDAVRSNWFVKI